MAFKDTIVKGLRNYFISGILIIVPLIITYLVLRFLFLTVDGLLSPLLSKFIGYKIPGVGFLATLILIFLIGFFASSVVFSRLVSFGESFFFRIPIVRTIYGPAKQLVESLTVAEKRAFKHVVLIQFPRQGVFTLGFVTNRVRFKKEEILAVFVPSTPTPLSGWTLLFKEKEVIPLDLTVEQGIEFFVSGGIASPETFPQKEKLDI